MATRKPRLVKYGGAFITNEETKAVKKSVDKSKLTGNWQQAEEGAKFEAELAEYLGVKHAILTNSGSSAGLLSLSALELARGSEVIISAVTFPTIFNIILQCGLIPVVVDAKVGTYGFSVEDVARAITPKTKAIIAIHPVGNPVDMVSLMKLVKGKDIKVIEDNCDGFGSTIGGKKVGTFGHISITSFHAAHIVCMGVGGGVFTNDPQLAKNVRMYRDWGRQANTTEPNKYPELPADYNPRFIYEKIGYNFQILDLQAAMGRVQIRKVDKIKELRAKNFNFLYNILRQYKELVLPTTVVDSDVCWFSFPITYTGDRGKLTACLEANGIETRSMFAGNITKHPAYKDAKYRVSGKLKEADYILEHSFWISLHPSLTSADRKHIKQVFHDFFAKV